MNDLVLKNTALPAHLQNKAAKQSNAAALGGIGGGTFPRISIRGSRWRAIIDGEENVLDLPVLKVVIVAANPNLSKMYFTKAYDANSDDQAPDCYSNDGIRPDARSEHVQSENCASCKHNVWGSKITPAGKKTRACADSKRVALLASDDLEGDLYGLNIPAASLRHLRDYVEKLDKRNIPITGVETSLSFDVDQSYPLILFTPSRYLTPEEFAVVESRLSDDQINVITGTKNEPMQESLPAPAPAAAPTAPEAPKSQLPKKSKPAPEKLEEPVPPAETTAPAAPKKGFGKGKKTEAAPAAAPEAPKPAPAQAAAAPAEVDSSELDSLLESLDLE